ncbi:hypothetical protein [Oleisolibacter albus]|uniref:hypothetical protein n=1 Tax=Oleisolibacter albus TaxID=2171757 RepID=UPI000DF278FC|nr:hypothetical protein [Oleisolibacter albus]
MGKETGELRGGPARDGAMSGHLPGERKEDEAKRAEVEAAHKARAEAVQTPDAGPLTPAAPLRRPPD